MAYVQTSGIFDDIKSLTSGAANTIGSGINAAEAAVGVPVTQRYGYQPPPSPGMPTWEKIALIGGAATAAYLLFFRKKSHGGAHSNPRRRRRRLRRR
jgi:hypothetical protein